MMRWRAVVVMVLGCGCLDDESGEVVIEPILDEPEPQKMEACRKAADCESRACLPEQLFKDADCETELCCAELCPCEGASQVCTIFDELQVCIEG